MSPFVANYFLKQFDGKVYKQDLLETKLVKDVYEGLSQLEGFDLP